MINNYLLFSVYPNPFNPSIKIEYMLNQIYFIDISILDLKGRLVDNLFSGNKMKGEHSIVWEPHSNLSSGVYLLRLKYDNQMFIEKISYIK